MRKTVNDLRILLVNSHAEGFRKIRASFPTTSDSELVDKIVEQVYDYYFIQRSALIPPFKRTKARPVRTRITYSYKAYTYLQRFKHEFSLTDAKVIRLLLPTYMNLLGDSS